jgi:hypothetical protein
LSFLQSLVSVLAQVQDVLLFRQRWSEGVVQALRVAQVLVQVQVLAQALRVAQVLVLVLAQALRVAQAQDALLDVADARLWVREQLFLS